MKPIAILCTNGFEEVELTEPKEKLEKDGYIIEIVSEDENIQSWHKRQWNQTFKADKLVEKANPADYAGLLLPGGVINPDRLRRNNVAVSFVKHFINHNKPVAAICHGPQMLIEAKGVKNKELTSFFSIQKDLENAGAKWIDRPVVYDHPLITSRTPADIEAFVAQFEHVLSNDK